MTKAELEKKHKDYEDWSPEWLFYMRSYFGGKRYRDGDYLLRHSLESETNYIRRKAMAFYYNYCAPIVDIFNSLLYSPEHKRDYGSLAKDPLFTSFLIDADFNGNSFKQFMREAQRFASIYGRVSILVDKSSAEVATKADQETLNLRPYLSIIVPENVFDWAYDRDASGKPILVSVKIKEGEGLYRIWTRDGWELYQVDDEKTKADVTIQPKDKGEHDLGRVPIVNLYNKTTLTKMIGVSDLEDIAYINRNIYYLCSDAQEVIENTAFPMLAMAMEKGGGKETKEIGPRNILQFDPDDPNSKPFWLEAPHSSLMEIREYIKQHRRTILQMANLLGIYISGESKQPVAGVAMEIENEQRDAALAEKAANMEEGEEQILELFALWQGKEFDGNINYADNFDIKNLDVDIQNILSALSQVDIQTRTGLQEIHKKLFRAILPKVDELTHKKIEGEVMAFTKLALGGPGKKEPVKKDGG